MMLARFCALAGLVLCGCVRLGFGVPDTDGERGLVGDAAGDSVLDRPGPGLADLGDAPPRPDDACAKEAGTDRDHGTTHDIEHLPDQSPLLDLPVPDLPAMIYTVVGTLTDAHADCSTPLKVDLSGLTGPVAVSVQLQSPASATALCPGSPSVIIEISSAPASLRLSCPGKGSTNLGWSKTCPLPKSGVYFTGLTCSTNPATLPTAGAQKSYIQLCLTLSKLPSMLVFASAP
jgi:hypothetical protein